MSAITVIVIHLYHDNRNIDYRDNTNYGTSVLQSKNCFSGCHTSCKGTCWEAGPTGCDECKEGWLHQGHAGCIGMSLC